MTLTEFLLARIDEAARQARRVGSVEHPLDQDAYFRVLRECDSKRKIVEELAAAHANLDPWGAESVDPRVVAYVTLERLGRILAAVYADHPDYRPEWAIENPTPPSKH